MKNTQRLQGFTIIELLVGTAVSLILSLAIVEIYFAQTRLYKTSNSQTLIQSGQNAISNLVTPIIRSTGFSGCGSMLSAYSNLISGGPSPLGSINVNPSMIVGYSGGTSGFTLPINATNSSSAADWSPALDASLVGSVEKGSDVLVVLGSAIGSAPSGLTAITSGSTTFNVQHIDSTIVAGQYGVVSDCAKSIVFQITSAGGTTIAHAAGSGALANNSNVFPVAFQVGAQFIPLQQTAFFVGQGLGGQSTLMRAILVNGAWSIQPIVPGVDLMKVQYGVGNNGVITQYVPASGVGNWSKVYAVRIGFLIEGQAGSGQANATNFSVLDIPITVPADNRLRHVFEMTINLRNALS